MNELKTSDRYQASRAAREVPVIFGESVFSDLLVELADSDDRVCYVGVDTMDPVMARKYPGRVFDVGICEQDEMTLATGLARVGMIPIVQAWSPFTPMRNYDQLRTSLARHKANVKIVSTALGLANCSHGATHHDMESLALLRMIPNLVVLAPMDDVQFASAMRQAMSHVGPVVILAPPLIYAPGHEGADWPEPVNHAPLPVGASEWLRQGADANLIAFGPALRYAWKAALRLAEQGLSVGVVNMCALKPLDAGIVLEAADLSPVIVTVEEQSILGGLGSAVAEVLLEAGRCPRFRRMGIPDVFVEDVGDWTDTRESIGLTVEGVMQCVRQLHGAR